MHYKKGTDPWAAPPFGRALHPRRVKAPRVRSRRLRLKVEPGLKSKSKPRSLPMSDHKSHKSRLALVVHLPVATPTRRTCCAGSEGRRVETRKSSGSLAIKFQLRSRSSARPPFAAPAALSSAPKPRTNCHQLALVGFRVAFFCPPGILIIFGQFLKTRRGFARHLLPRPPCMLHRSVPLLFFA
jgi:hypothetical protein